MSTRKKPKAGSKKLAVLRFQPTKTRRAVKRKFIVTLNLPDGVGVGEMCDNLEACIGEVHGYCNEERGHPLWAFDGKVSVRPATGPGGK